MKMKLIEFQRIASYLMEQLVEDTERDWDKKHDMAVKQGNTNLLRKVD